MQTTVSASQDFDDYVTHSIQQLAQQGSPATSEAIVAKLLENKDQYLPGDQIGLVQYLTETEAYAREHLGEKHPHALLALHELAVSNAGNTDYVRAEEQFRRVIAYRIEVLGENHIDTIASKWWLAGVYWKLERYKDAEQLQEQVYSARKSLFGDEHQRTVTTMRWLGKVYIKNGKYSKAVDILKEAVRIQREISSEDSEKLYLSMLDLGVAYYVSGQPEAAELLLDKLLTQLRSTYSLENRYELELFNNLALVYEAQEKYGEAAELLFDVFESKTKLLGHNDEATLVTGINLGVIYLKQGKLQEAENLISHIYGKKVALHGQNSLEILKAKNNLASAYNELGRYGEAEKYQREIIYVARQELGERHPDTLVYKKSLAKIYMNQGRYQEAKNILQEIIEANVQYVGTDRLWIDGIKADMAVCLKNLGDTDKALKIYQESLDSVTQKRSADSLMALTIKSNIAALYIDDGLYPDKAETILRDVLALKTGKLGAEHPSTLDTRANLAMSLLARGELDDAEVELYAVWSIRKKVLGVNHPDTLTTFQHLINLYIRQGKVVKALQCLVELEAMIRDYVDLIIQTTLSERVRRTMLNVAADFQVLVFRLANEHPSPETTQFAADIILRWKGVTLESESQSARLLRHAETGELRDLAIEVESLRSRLASIVNRPLPDAVNGDLTRQIMQERARKIATIRQQLDLKENAIAGISSEYSNHLAKRKVGWKQIRNALPNDSALIELRIYEPEFEGRDQRKRYHWMVLVLSHDEKEPPIVRDLGPVEASIQHWKDSRASKNSESYNNVNRALYVTLFSALDAELQRFKHLYIAPDYLLQMASFASLVLPDDRYWVERQTLHQVLSGRDLLSNGNTKKGRGLLALGGVNYGQWAGGSKVAQQPAATMLAAHERLRSQSGVFKSLAYTEKEVVDIASRYRQLATDDAQVLDGTDATESALKNMDMPPRLLHLATHGFFLAQNQRRTERPLTLGGLALSGANLGMQGKVGPDGEDGILYALEVLGLNLDGTELVVLSACDTGLGQVDYSEGVYSLLRAFRIAGARSVLATLWPLSDVVASEFMSLFYLAWLSEQENGMPLNPVMALRKVQLFFIKHPDPRKRNPLFWAPYVLTESR